MKRVSQMQAKTPDPKSPRTTQRHLSIVTTTAIGAPTPITIRIHRPNPRPMTLRPPRRRRRRRRNSRRLLLNNLGHITMIRRRRPRHRLLDGDVIPFRPSTITIPPLALLNNLNDIVASTRRRRTPTAPNHLLLVRDGGGSDGAARHAARVQG